MLFVQVLLLNYFVYNTSVHFKVILYFVLQRWPISKFCLLMRFLKKCNTLLLLPFTLLLVDLQITQNFYWKPCQKNKLGRGTFCILFFCRHREISFERPVQELQFGQGGRPRQQAVTESYLCFMALADQQFNISWVQSGHAPNLQPCSTVEQGSLSLSTLPSCNVVQ